MIDRVCRECETKFSSIYDKHIVNDDVIETERVYCSFCGSKLKVGEKNG